MWLLLVTTTLGAAEGFLSSQASLSSSLSSSFGRRRGVVRMMSSAQSEAAAVYEAKYGSLSTSSLLYASPAKVKSTFSTLAKIYGEEASLEMTKRSPAILAYNPAYFAPSYKNFADAFGDDETKAMVLRNPNLLAVSPKYSANPGPEAMALSYVVAFTRPVGPLLLAILFTCIATPFIEKFAGLPIRPTLLGLLGLSS